MEQVVAWVRRDKLKNEGTVGHATVPRLFVDQLAVEIRGEACKRVAGDLVGRGFDPQVVVIVNDYSSFGVD
jgi:hypothetical protein